MFFSVRKAALIYLHLCLPLLLSAVPLTTAAEISLEPHVGFHGLFRLGHPFPLRVDLTNSGRPVEGTLEVRVWKGGASRGVGAYPVFYRRVVFLSAQSRKSVQFTVDPDSISRPLTLTFSSQSVKLSKEVDLRRHFSPSPLILLLTENSVSPPIPLAPDASSHLISLSIGDLPSDPRAYQGVSTVIFYEQSLRDLSKPQTMALETWLSSGGRLLVLGSMHYALYQEPSMSRFLPVQVTGLKRFSSLPSLERFYGKKVSSLRNALAQDSKFIEGRILIQERETPILVEMNRGRGKVFYLSLDVGRPPLSRWEGLSLLFRDLLGSSPEGGLPLQASWDEAIFSQLLLTPSFIATYVPVRPFLLWLLFYLGGLGLLAHLWLQQRWPRRTLIAAFLFLVFFSSFGGYIQFNRGGNVPDGVLLSSTLLDNLPDGYVEAQSNVALFSTRKRHYNLQVESGWIDLEPVFPRSGAPEDTAMMVQEEGRSTQFRFGLREWDYRLFKVRSLARFPLLIEVQNQGNKLFLKLSNLTTKDLSECWLVASGQRFYLGDILQGSSEFREFPLSSERRSSKDGQSNMQALREIPFNDKMREVLFRNSFFPQDRGVTHWGSGALLLIGWVKGASRRVWVDDARIIAHDYTLFRATIPLDGEEDS